MYSHLMDELREAISERDSDYLWRASTRWCSQRIDDMSGPYTLGRAVMALGSEYVNQCAIMTIGLFENLPDLHPDVPWHLWGDKTQEIMKNRVRTRDLLHLVSTLGRNQNMLDALRYLTGNDSMDAKIGNYPLRECLHTAIDRTTPTP